MFDLSKIKALDTAEVILKDGDGIPYVDEKGEELKVNLHGPATPIALKLKEAAKRKAIAQLRKMRKNPNLEPDYEQQEKENVEYLIEITRGFNFKIADLKGEEMIREFYTNPEYDLLAKQVNDFLTKTGTFLPKA